VREIWASGKAVVKAGAACVELLGRVMAHAAGTRWSSTWQHGMIDYQVMVTMLQAISTTNTVPLVRVRGTTRAHPEGAGRGAYGIICPMINNRAEAEKFVGSCRYAPLGYRSSGRSALALRRPDYHMKANDIVLCFRMIETKEALDNLDDILSVKGLMRSMSTSDLSISWATTRRRQARRMDDGGAEEGARMPASAQGSARAALRRAGLCKKAIEWASPLSRSAATPVPDDGAAAAVAEMRDAPKPGAQQQPVLSTPSRFADQRRQGGKAQRIPPVATEPAWRHCRPVNDSVRQWRKALRVSALPETCQTRMEPGSVVVSLQTGNDHHRGEFDGHHETKEKSREGHARAQARDAEKRLRPQGSRAANRRSRSRCTESGQSKKRKKAS